jgi:hypothetical protein
VTEAPTATFLPAGRSYQLISRLTLLPGNPRVVSDANFKNLCESLKRDPRFLLRRPPLVADGPRHRAGAIVYGGNQRVRAIAELFRQGWKPPADLAERGWGEGMAPVDVDDIAPQLARERALQDNNTWGAWDEPLLAAMVRDLGTAGSDLGMLGFSTAELEALLGNTGSDGQEAETERRSIAGRRPQKRVAPLDLIFTFADLSHPVSHVAVGGGFLLGFRSTDLSKRGGTQSDWAGPVNFVDNDFLHYDHAEHLAAVRQLRPKYCTVRDIMTRQQCAAAGTEYFTLQRILGFAEELQRYAEHVIVIPKYDCIDKIPPQYVLGYSVPSSYGGTPVPIARFKGRRIHLLGGPWNDQLGYLAAAGDDVVSLDTNVATKAALWGSVYKADGSNVKLEQELGLRVNNAFSVGVAISLGSIARAVYDLFPADKRLEPEALSDEMEAATLT